MMNPPDHLPDPPAGETLEQLKDTNALIARLRHVSLDFRNGTPCARRRSCHPSRTAWRLRRGWSTPTG